MISVFGATGFIGSHFCEMYPDMTISVHRQQRVPYTKEILYLISTTHNYNNLSFNYELLLALNKIL